jgi:hypothetical protein
MRSRRFRYSLRALLILVTLAGVAFAWVHQARQQGAAVESLVESNPSCRLYYDGDSSLTHWTADLLGPDYLANVVGVQLFYATDADLERLARLERLESISLQRSIDITDSGLRHLRKLNRLKRLTISDAEQLTDAGLRQLATLTSLEYLRVDRGRHPISPETLDALRRALPKCRIEVGGEADVKSEVAAVVSHRSAMIQAVALR